MPLGHRQSQANALAHRPFLFKRKPERKIAVFTSINRQYLAKASILAQSLKKHHPDWDMHILVNDYWDYEWEVPFVDKFVTLAELSIEYLESWIFSYDVVELSTASRPIYFQKLLELGYEYVIFLDPDILIVSELGHIIAELGKHDLLLTPHTDKPSLRDIEILRSEVSVLAHGIYNLGFLAARNCENVRNIVSYWRYRLRRYSTRDHAMGVFTDQKWFNLVPLFFPRVGILSHTGCNVASWNVAHRPLTQKDGRLFAGKDPLLFFHFSGYDVGVPQKMFNMFGAYNDTVASLIRDYNARNTAAEQLYKPMMELPSVFDHFDNGEKVIRALRVYYREHFHYRMFYKHPYSASEGSFYSHTRDYGVAQIISEFDSPTAMRRHYN